MRGEGASNLAPLKVRFQTPVMPEQNSSSDSGALEDVEMSFDQGHDDAAAKGIDIPTCVTMAELKSSA
jgi:hypothetical protein